jgi:sec-independent protein translocase protein TatB
MFGIGFTEFMLIFIIAILFLGPDKLPGAISDIAKLIKSLKKTINDAKSSIEEEIKVADLKAEALNYKDQLNDATKELQEFKNLRFDDFDEETTYGEEVSSKSSMETLTASERHRLQIEQEAKQKKEEALAEQKLAEHATDTSGTLQVEQKQPEDIVLKKREKVAKNENNTPAPETPENNDANQGKA